MLYNSGDPELLAVQAKCLEKMYDYNATRPSEGEKRAALIKEMFGSAGEGCYIEPPFHANWGGKNVHLGDNVYANFNLTCVDDCEIFIGDGTMLGPSVVLASASHPICPELRKKAYQFNLPVRIGKNCWLGAGVIVLPGSHRRRQYRGRRGQRGHARPSRKRGRSRFARPRSSPD